MANQITTFYSYKGGTGRSMALANTAVLLAKWGYKVLMVDWDLEAPGLEHFFSSYLNPWLIQDNNGLVDLLDDAFKSGGSPTRIKWNDIVMNIRMPECAGSIDLITSGRRDDNYFPRLRRFDVKEFYQKRKGGYYIERLRDDWKNVYDHIVIDSRTGITDLGGICTAHLPDVITLLFTPTEQSVGGTLQVYRKIQEARQRLTFERLNLVAIPVPSRIDTGQEFEISQKWLDHVAITFEEIYSNWLPTSINKRKILEITKLPYISYFSFGEKLPVIEQGTTDPAGLGYAYEALAGLIASGLENAEVLIEERNEFIRANRKPQRDAVARVFISYSHKDEEWKDKMLTHLKVLEARGRVIVWEDRQIAAGHEWYRSIADEIDSADVAILLISADYLSSSFLIREEVPRLLMRSEKHGLRIIPVIVRSSAWQLVEWLSRMQVFPRDGKPLARMKEEHIDESLASLVAEIAAIAEQKVFDASPIPPAANHP